MDEVDATWEIDPFLVCCAVDEVDRDRPSHRTHEVDALRP